MPKAIWGLTVGPDIWRFRAALLSGEGTETTFRYKFRPIDDFFSTVSAVLKS
jgi:hypothetical protein